jgi:general stress protein 26
MSDLRQRIIDAAREPQLLNFATVTEDGRPWVRYVVGSADDGLVFRFCTHLETRKVGQIRKNPNVHISMGVKDLETAEHWLQVAGTAEISTNRDERHAFWFDELANYFSGPDDPNYCIVIVRPSLIEFGTMGSITPEVWEPES